MAASGGAFGVAVVADDTDVYLLPHHYLEQILDRSVMDMKATAALHADLIPNLLA